MNAFRSSLVLVLSAALLTLGCASSSGGGGGRVTADKVSQIQVGTTTKAQIQQWFGPPSNRSFSASTGETWVYNQGASRTKQASKGIGGALIGAAAGAASSAAGPVGSAIPRGSSSSSSNENTNLSVVFDKRGVVKDFSYASQR